MARKSRGQRTVRVSPTPDGFWKAHWTTGNNNRRSSQPLRTKREAVNVARAKEEWLNGRGYTVRWVVEDGGGDTLREVLQDPDPETWGWF